MVLALSLLGLYSQLTWKKGIRAILSRLLYFGWQCRAVKDVHTNAIRDYNHCRARLGVYYKALSWSRNDCVVYEICMLSDDTLKSVRDTYPIKQPHARFMINVGVNAQKSVSEKFALFGIFGIFQVCPEEICRDSETFAHVRLPYAEV